MDKRQIKNSGLLILSNIVLNAAGFVKQMIMAWALGLSSQIDLLLLSMIVPSIIQSMIGGGAGEIMVIKREKAGYSEGSFETLYILLCLLPAVILGLLYLLLLPCLLPFFDIGGSDTRMFYIFSLVFLVNMVPGTFVSVLRPHLYSRELYRFFSVSTIVSQAAGIIFIAVTVKALGIWSFAWGYLLTSFLNAAWFSFKSGLKFKLILSREVWKHEAEELTRLFRRVASLSAQTLLNHLATFWERSLSVKHLAPGYLSSLNYSKTLNELPNSVILSSVLTTSYIEQVRLHKEDYGAFEKYTERTLRLVMNAGFLLQTVMMVLAPAILILIFRRGKFDNNAVETTLLIFNILTVGFIPKLVMNYFSRTMYILGEYRKLLFIMIVRVTLHISVLLLLVNVFTQTIPVAAVGGTVFMAVVLYAVMLRKMQLPSLWIFAGRIALITAMSVLILYVHLLTLQYYIQYSNLQILLIFLPLMICSAFVLLVFMKRNNIEPGFIVKIRRLVWKS